MQQEFFTNIRASASASWINVNRIFRNSIYFFFRASISGWNAVIVNDMLNIRNYSGSMPNTSDMDSYQTSQPVVQTMQLAESGKSAFDFSEFFFIRSLSFLLTLFSVGPYQFTNSTLNPTQSTSSSSSSSSTLVSGHSQVLFSLKK
jgi:hypothetical protein